MIINSKSKRIILSFLLILCFSLLSASVFADGGASRPIYFKYRDGVVRDGSVGDRAGVIGDEDEAERLHRRHTLPTSSLVGGNNNSINDNVLPRDNNRGDMLRSSDNASDSDEGAASTVFWGIVIVMTIAAAIILLIVLMTPKNTKKSK